MNDHPSAPSRASAAFSAPRAGDFENVTNLLAVLGEANRQLAALTREIETAYVALVNPHRERYAKLQSTVAETEAALETIARRNPQWFEERKTLATPFGGLKFTRSTELVVDDENISLQLIAALGGPSAAAKYLRTVQVLNKEALATLDDAALARFGLARRTKENFSAGTDLVHLGRSFKPAAKATRQAA